MIKRPYFSIIVSFILMLAFSCQKEDVSYISDFVPSIVVDGHIELGGFPQVSLTRNIPYYVNLDSSDLIYLVLRQAKVMVTDGVKAEILTLMYDTKSFPPFYYKGTDLKGEAGKTYSLMVVYGKDTLRASTTVPNPVKADSVWFKTNQNEPEKGVVYVRLKDNPSAANYYKFFTRIQGKQDNYFPTLISNFSDRPFNGETFTFVLNKGPETYLSLNQNDLYFQSSDTTWLKVCTMDKDHFDFWNSYQSEVINGGNPFSSSFHNVASNIKGKGIGIWGGYGVSLYRVTSK